MYSTLNFKSLESSVGKATGYGLDDQGVGVHESREGQEFSLFHVFQTGFEFHPTSYPMGAGSPSLGGIAVGA
jgi:hypothetical protein